MLTIPSLKFLPVGNHPQPLAGGAAAAAAGGAVKMDEVLAGPSYHRDVNTDILCPGPVATCPASPRLPAAAAENCRQDCSYTSYAVVDGGGIQSNTMSRALDTGGGRPDHWYSAVIDTGAGYAAISTQSSGFPEPGPGPIMQHRPP